MTKADDQVLKTDRLGRVQTPKARREELLDEFERSGLSGIKFAALTGVKYPTFAAWLKRRRQRNAIASVPAKPVDSMRWLEAVVEQAQSPGVPNSAGLVLELPGGARLQIGNVNQAVLAAALVRALEKSC
jgi:ribosomal protein S12 methylthiotransferase accessory factor YcaO